MHEHIFGVSRRVHHVEVPKDVVAATFVFLSEQKGRINWTCCSGITDHYQSLPDECSS